MGRVRHSLCLVNRKCRGACMRAQVRALNEKLTQLSAKVAAAVPLPSNCTVVVIPAPG